MLPPTFRILTSKRPAGAAASSRKGHRSPPLALGTLAAPPPPRAGSQVRFSSPGLSCHPTSLQVTRSRNLLSETKQRAYGSLASCLHLRRRRP